MVGFVFGIGAILLEVPIWRRAPSPVAVALYALMAGFALTAARAFFWMFLRDRFARKATLVCAFLGILVIPAYWVNVVVLMDHTLDSPVALGVDALGLMLGLLLAVPLARSRRLRLWQNTLPIAAAPVLLATGIGVLAWNWPAPGAVVPSTRTDGPNIVLLVLDSVRRDHLGLHGYPAPTSPELDAIGAQARIFETTSAAGSATTFTVPQLLHPRGLADRVQSLAGKAGYATAAFTDNPHLHREAPFMAGFDRVGGGGLLPRRLLGFTVVGDVLEKLFPPGDVAVVDRSIAWAERVGGPFFLYVHLMDAHAPYRFSPLDGVVRGGRRLTSPFTGLSLTAEEAEDLIARYDGGVRSTQREGVRLLTALAALERPTLAIITADHGDSLGEEGRWFHGDSLAPELLDVPLWLWGAGVEPGRIAARAGHDSVGTTILAAMGDDTWSGSARDLRVGVGDDLIEGGCPPTNAYRIVGDRKVILDAAGRLRLYDLSADPLELHDLAPADPSGAKSLAEGLTIGAEGAALPPELVLRLRALGYND